MEFTFHTVYNHKALVTLSKAVRKTIRKKSNRFSHILGYLCIVLAVWLSIPLEGEPFVIDFSLIITWLAAIVILIILLFEDHLNAYASQKTTVCKIKDSTTTFTENCYSSVTAVGTTEWKYDSILGIVETPDYFICLLDKFHGQLYDKSSLSGGTVEEFRQFLTEKTGKPIQSI